MKIYTSYFGNWRNFPPDALVLGVTRYPFKELPFPNEQKLAPSEELLLEFKNGNLDEKSFTIRFKSELFDRGFKNGKDLALALAQSSGGQDIVLCCYEKKGQFCHRQILGDMMRRYGVEVEEL